MMSAGQLLVELDYTTGSRDKVRCHVDAALNLRAALQIHGRIERIERELAKLKREMAGIKSWPAHSRWNYEKLVRERDQYPEASPLTVAMSRAESVLDAWREYD